VRTNRYPVNVPLYIFSIGRCRWVTEPLLDSRLVQPRCNWLAGVTVTEPSIRKIRYLQEIGLLVLSPATLELCLLTRHHPRRRSPPKATHSPGQPRWLWIRMGISSLAIIRIFSASVLRGLSSAWRRIGNWVLKMATEIPSTRWPRVSVESAHFACRRQEKHRVRQPHGPDGGHLIHSFWLWDGDQVRSLDCRRGSLPRRW
jgi:hypothetical protein